MKIVLYRNFVICVGCWAFFLLKSRPSTEHKRSPLPKVCAQQFVMCPVCWLQRRGVAPSHYHWQTDKQHPNPKQYQRSWKALHFLDKRHRVATVCKSWRLSAPCLLLRWCFNFHLSSHITGHNHIQIITTWMSSGKMESTGEREKIKLRRKSMEEEWQ